jgi:hypothetical protein
MDRGSVHRMAADNANLKGRRLSLSPELLEALRNLSRKQAGDPVGFIAIAPARELTELGFAARNRSGWQITPDGQAMLEEQADPGSSDRPMPIQFSDGAATQ